MNQSDAYRLLHKGSVALAQVESNGLRIDVPYLDNKIRQITYKIKKEKEELKQDEIYKVWEKTFKGRDNPASLGSRYQLGKVLFDVLGYESRGKTGKTKRYKTDEATLLQLKCPFVQRWLKLEKLKKVKATYFEGIRKETINGYLHPFFHLHTAESYRGSSSDPNFQNLPIRNFIAGRVVRQAFIPRPGCVLVENDFSAHEFRIAASVWKDPRMIAYAKDKRKDIHRDLAMKCFKLTKEEVNKDSRYVAKNGFVFPRLYGSYYVQIAKNMWLASDQKKLKVNNVPMKEHLASKGITKLGNCDPKQSIPQKGTFEEQVKKVQDWWDGYFSEFRKSSEDWISRYRKNGSFPLPTGFQCEGLYTNNALMNYPIQGGAFHCLLWTLIELQKELRKRHMKALIVGQIHDCIIADVPEEELQDYLNLVKELVEVRLPKAWDWLIVPLEIEAEVAEPTWWDKKPWIYKGGKWEPK